MRVETTRYGVVDVSEEDVLEFERGLFGFEDVHRWVLLEHGPKSPLRLLQSVETPGLAFVVLEPFLICPDYTLELSAEDAAAVHWWDDTGVLVLVTVGIPEDPGEMTANLKGPILVNPKRQRGRQVVLPGDRWSPRYRVLDAAAESNPEV